MRRLLCVLVLWFPLYGWAQSQSGVELSVGEGRLVRFGQPVDSVLIGSPEVADLQVVSPGVVYVFGKRSGHTNLIALDAGEREIASLDLQVGSGTSGVRQALNRSGRPSAVRVEAAGNRLVAQGSVAGVESAIDLNALLDPAGQDWQGAVNTASYPGSAQVNIRVRFAEVSREELLRYGVSWNALFNNGTFSFGLLTGGNLPSEAVAGASNLITAGLSGNNFNIDTVLESLQSHGVLEILAEPNITAVTGETASFLAGGEVPIPVPVNRDLVGIEYKSYGVSLMFSPTLLPNERIGLQVRPEVSSLVGGSVQEIAGYRVPSFRVRRADTRVEVGSGQTFAIAGLFQRDNAQDLEKIPLLGDMPILGNLFRSKRFQRSETELVILITPYLVQPVRARTLATPLDPSRQAHGQMLARRPASSSFGFLLQ